MKTNVCGAAVCALFLCACATPKPNPGPEAPGGPSQPANANAQAPAAGVKVIVENLSNQEATPQFKFTRVPVPCRNDAAVEARVRSFSGAVDEDSGGTDKLIDGTMPTEPDQPG